VEIQNQDSHFLTAPISLRRKEEIISKDNKSKSRLHKTLDTAPPPRGGGAPGGGGFRLGHEPDGGREAWDCAILLQFPRA
jgi:hypothetical protein